MLYTSITICVVWYMHNARVHDIQWAPREMRFSDMWKSLYYVDFEEMLVDASWICLSDTSLLGTSYFELSVRKWQRYFEKMCAMVSFKVNLFHMKTTLSKTVFNTNIPYDVDGWCKSQFQCNIAKLQSAACSYQIRIFYHKLLHVSKI